jgi:RecA-family ATPase
MDWQPGDPDFAKKIADELNGAKPNGHANGANQAQPNGSSHPKNTKADGSSWRTPPWIYDPEPLHALDFTTLPDVAPFTREWVVPLWFPMLETVGFGGPGGEGKTLLAQMLGTAAVLGGSWLEMPVKEMKAALMLCEDRDNDAHWRQIDINRRYGCKMHDLAGRLKIYPRRNNQHNYLGIFDNDGDLHVTPTFDQLLTDLRGFGAQLVILDTRADVFRGDQNDEAQARTFVRKITDRIAWELDGLVVLLFQPSRAGFRQGTGESGSVQWDASFRARCYLEGAGEDDDPDIRHLTCLKSNFSAKGQTLDIRWKDGVFERKEAAEASKPDYERGVEKSKAERVFLHCLSEFTAQCRNVSAIPGSPSFAPKLFAASPASEGCTVKALDRAMGVLFHRKVIRNETHGPPSKGQSRIVKVADSAPS